jgi:hypothetical protein
MRGCAGLPLSRTEREPGMNLQGSSRDKSVAEALLMTAANQLKDFQLAAALVCVALLASAIIKPDVCRERRTAELYSSASISSILK